MWSWRTLGGFVGADPASSQAISGHPEGHRLVREVFTEKSQATAPRRAPPRPVVSDASALGVVATSANFSAADVALVAGSPSHTDIDTLSLEQLRLLIGISGLTDDDCKDEAELRARAHEAISSYVRSLSGASTSCSGSGAKDAPYAVGESVAVQGTALASPAPVTNLADELQKLASLRDSGILTEEEFKAAKAKCLGLAR